MPVKTKVLIEHTDDSCSSANNSSVQDEADIEPSSDDDEEQGSMKGECTLPDS